jgi:outer membrane murein-binding lipoprotein Lpp
VFHGVHSTQYTHDCLNIKKMTNISSEVSSSTEEINTLKEDIEWS